ncbi:MAG: serine/threonine protein kinase, partial [Verrucomicrobia bacterium]|nr:serine/threonine protein kinase [Verrucomicrobiota bacterium]
PGTKIGRYKLLQQIGEGGMGVVYMAEQEEPVRRRVAQKIIKLGMDSKQVVARFEAERQALAMMDHPNIARVLDGGTTESGRPYFVMELVQGVPLVEFCDKSKLAPRERLELFIQVCQAVQSAHQKGIIHRDLKPSNILVTLLHGKPMPKVIDFGIAKATNQRLTERTLFTNYATMIGTPAYMSPEQAEMTSLDVDTRSDIYSLGVLLYELLTGSTPFPEKRLRSLGYGEMQRVIAEEEPERPSARLSTLGNEQKTVVAKDRGEDLEALSTLLRGDLDCIVMKCLEKDRARRYETANGLAADLKRHLENEPVSARPPSAGYRFQKAFRRNKVAFVAASAIAAALLLGTIISTWQSVRATRAKQQAQAAQAGEILERERAEVNAQRAIEAQANEAKLRRNAEAMELVSRHQSYAADMNLVQQALELNNLGRAKMFLNRYKPQTGQQDLRDWEWRYLWQQCQSDALFRLGTLPSVVQSISVSHDGRWVAAGGFRGGNIAVWDTLTKQNGLFAYLCG